MTPMSLFLNSAPSPTLPLFCFLSSAIAYHLTTILSPLLHYYLPSYHHSVSSPAYRPFFLFSCTIANQLLCFLLSCTIAYQSIFSLVLHIAYQTILSPLVHYCLPPYHPVSWMQSELLPDICLTVIWSPAART
jgi:hypothetical protein